MAARTPAGAEPPAPNAAGTNNANSAGSQTPPKMALPDGALYGLIAEGVPVQVSAGQFTVFFPEDGHIPSCAWGDSTEVVKVVVKVRV